MSLEIRVLNDDADLIASQGAFMTSLVAFPSQSQIAPIADFFEPGHSLGAFQDGALVGTAMSFTGSIVVPGGNRLPHAAVTDVGVLPTHTRRGIATALMGRLLAQIAQRGEPIASLRATEAVIYERFGYGIASSSATVELDLASTRLRPGVPAGGPVRFVDSSTSWQLLARIYEQSRRAPSAPAGTIERVSYWWRWQAHGAAQAPGPRHIVVHGEPGAEDGYLRYRPDNAGFGWFEGARAVLVSDFVAVTPSAYYGLLRYLLSLDLVHRVVLGTMPVDHSIEKLMVDERAARITSIEDETWLRLIDVAAALSGRAYRGNGTVAIEVSDDLLPANTGVYVVSAKDVTRNDTAAADLSLEVSALAALYLGGTRWWQLALCGRVREHTPGALAVADELFAVERPPFSGTMF